jgi:cell division protein FtsN
MADHEAEAGHEVVLDNRKLIVLFVVLIAFCGGFFVVGFMEGKRQGFQDGVQTASESAKKSNPVEKQAQESDYSANDSGADPTKDAESDPQITWYNNVNRGEGDPGIETTLTESPSSQKAEALPAKNSSKELPRASSKESTQKASPEPSSKVLPQVKAATDEQILYSVQVGAFRVRREVEIKAKELRAKGFIARIELPQSSKDLYLLKIGKFNSRAEATAMQFRLKKSGISSFVKIN